ncbi:MAG: hypothetical protein JWR26_3354 [Pedosphaera sp.]|nr:hypothetical protein [Pedosphaera sp.]
MQLLCLLLIGFLGSGLATMAEQQPPIDRHALVARHDIDWPSVEGQIPLGNGNFAFNADGTGLETVGGNTMCHWCWHSFPLPPGVRQITPWATPDHGRLTGPTAHDPRPIAEWERINPQPLNLGRLGFINQEGDRLTGSDVRVDSRHLELWTGLLTSRFTYLGEPVVVQTCVDPKSDTVAVQVVSPLLRDGRLQMMLDFPAPAQNVGGWVGDFSKAAGHETIVVRQKRDRLELKRSIDDARYEVLLAGSGFTAGQPTPLQPEIESARYGVDDGGWADATTQVARAIHDYGAVSANNDLAGDPALHRIKRLEIKYRLHGEERMKSLAENESWSIGGGASAHRFILTPNAGTDTVSLTCHFGTNGAGTRARKFEEVKKACATAWPAFWKSGGAIDLSQSSDPRWMELERRIVLSQYELAAQSAGDYPPAEVGLTGTDPWLAKWHFEMIWWHLAHYALWDRWAMAEKALTIYSSVAPVAKSIAKHFDYQGLMWPKSTGPNGFNDGFPPEMALLWKEPHPIFFAELDYRLHPTHQTLIKWKDIVFGTAEFMADYPTRDGATGQYNLDPAWPASEGRVNPLRRNTIFELGYWRVGLNMAQQWRLRLGLQREPHWDEVAAHLAPLPEKDGLYIFSEDRPDTFSTRTFDHVDNIGIAGMLPPFDGLDPATARRTVEEVGRKWNWDATWGWDFPWMAMAAARVGDSKLAIEALLNPSSKNHYDERGICTGGPGPYLPGNGGLLYAVAMMAAGWDGAPHRLAPGFPDDGSWTVRWEDLKPAP